jgi:hypothetical protein
MVVQAHPKNQQALVPFPVRVTALTPILNVSNVPESIRWFERLGWERCFTWNAAGMIQHAALENTHGPAHFASVGTPKDPAVKTHKACATRAPAPIPKATTSAPCG